MCLSSSCFDGCSLKGTDGIGVWGPPVRPRSRLRGACTHEKRSADITNKLPSHLPSIFHLIPRGGFRALTLPDIPDSAVATASITLVVVRWPLWGPHIAHPAILLLECFRGKALPVHHARTIAIWWSRATIMPTTPVAAVPVPYAAGVPYATPRTTRSYVSTFTHSHVTWDRDAALAPRARWFYREFCVLLGYFHSTSDFWLTSVKSVSVDVCRGLG